MGRTSIRRALGALTALTFVVAACGDDEDEEGGSATTTEAPADGETTTTAGGGGDEAGEGGEADEAVEVGLLDYSFDGLPDTLEAGAVTLSLDNTGAVDHEIAFVTLGDDTGAEQFFTDFAPVVQEGGAWPEYARTGVGAVSVAAGDTGEYVLTLPEGRYMAFCSLDGDAEDPEAEGGGEPHFARGMQQIVEVTGGGAADLPEADGTITATDYGFDVDIPAGATTVNFLNDGANPHFAGVDRFPDGTTAEEAEEAFRTLVQSEEGQPPPEGTPEPEELFFSGVATEGLGTRSRLPAPIEPGTYVAYCFLSDFEGGPPHAIGMDMIVGFTVD